jgi:hypothetical protein
MRRLGGSASGKSSGCSFVQIVRKAEGQWEDCRDNYIAACRAASAALRFREAFEGDGVGGKLFPHAATTLTAETLRQAQGDSPGNRGRTPTPLSPAA